MQLAYAMQMPTEAHEDEHMDMSSMTPMSPVHCKDCVHEEKQNQNPCDSGHCVSEATAQASGVNISSVLQVAIPVAQNSAIYLGVHEEEINTIDATAPPLTERINTIVLRL